MKRKTLWRIECRCGGSTTETYYVTAGNAVSASKRGLILAKKEDDGHWFNTPYVSEVHCCGEVVVF